MIGEPALEVPRDCCASWLRCLDASLTTGLEQCDWQATVRRRAPAGCPRAHCADGPRPGTPYAPPSLAGSYRPDSARGDWRARPAADVPAGSPPRDDGSKAEALPRQEPGAWAPSATGWPPAARVPVAVVPDGLRAARSPRPCPSQAAAGRLASVLSEGMQAAARQRPGAQGLRATGWPPVALRDDESKAEVLSRQGPGAQGLRATGWPPSARVPAAASSCESRPAHPQSPSQAAVGPQSPEAKAAE